jgi:hypothetical protein
MSMRSDRTWLLLSLALSVLLNVAIGALFICDDAPGTDAALTSMPLDDSFIHLVYARAIAEEGQLAYNVGEAEAGATSPLWAFVLAAIFVLKRLGLALSTILAAKAVGVLCAIGATWLGAVLTRRLSASTLAGGFAMLCIAIDPAFSFARVSGMEVPLASLLALGGIYAVLGGSSVWAAACFGLAPLARPELLLLTPIGLLAIVLSFRDQVGATGSRSGYTKPMGAVLALTLPSLLWAGYCLSVSGHPFPNTFYAKHVGESLLDHLSDAPLVIGATASDVPSLLFGVGLLLAVLGAVHVARARQPSRWLSLSIAVSPGLLWLGVIWAHRLTQPLAFYWYRYTQPVLPLLTVWMVVGLCVLWRRGDQVARGRRMAARGLVGLVALLVIAFSVIALPARAHLFAWNSQNILENQVAIGRWLSTHARPELPVATVDAGAIRYYSHRRTIDLIGLNDHRVLARGVAAVLREEQPAAFVIFPRGALAQLMNAPWLQLSFETRSSNYTICNCDQAHMVVLTRTQFALLKSRRGASRSARGRGLTAGLVAHEAGASVLESVQSASGGRELASPPRAAVAQAAWP